MELASLGPVSGDGVIVPLAASPTDLGHCRRAARRPPALGDLAERGALTRRVEARGCSALPARPWRSAPPRAGAGPATYAADAPLRDQVDDEAVADDLEQSAPRSVYAQLGYRPKTTDPGDHIVTSSRRDRGRTGAIDHYNRIIEFTDGSLVTQDW